MVVSTTPKKIDLLRSTLKPNLKLLLMPVSCLVLTGHILTLLLLFYFGYNSLSRTRLNLQVIYHNNYFQFLNFDASALEELKQQQTLQPGDKITAFDKTPIPKFLSDSTNTDKLVIYTAAWESSKTLLVPGQAINPPFQDGQFLLLWSVKAESLTLDISNRSDRSFSTPIQVNLSQVASKAGQHLLIVVLIIIALVFWLVSLLLYLVQPARQITILFSLLCNLVALEVVVSTTESYLFGSLEKVVLILCSGFMGLVFLHFVCLFPNSSILKTSASKLFKLFYLISFLAASVRLVVTLSSSTQGTPLLVEAPVRNFSYLLFLIFTLMAIGVLITKLINANKVDRNRLKLAVIAIFVAVIIPLIPLSGYLLFGLWSELVADRFGIFFVPLLFVPPFFAYAVVKNKLLGIDLRIRRIFVVGLLTLAILLCYFVVSAFLTIIFPFWENLGKEPVIITLFLAGFTVLLYQLRLRVQMTVDRAFGIDPLNYAELNSYWSKELVKTTQLYPLLDKVINQMAQNYHYKESYLLLTHPQLLQSLNSGSLSSLAGAEVTQGNIGNGVLALLLTSGHTVLPSEIVCKRTSLLNPNFDADSLTETETTLCGFIFSSVNLEAFKDSTLPFLLLNNELTLPKYDKALSPFSFLHCQVSLKLSVGDQFYGLWLLGEKTGEYLPTFEELDHLNSVANQVSIACYNSLLLTQAVSLAQTEVKLRKLGELMQTHRERAVDEERSKLAEALHNDVLQDLFNTSQDLDKLASDQPNYLPSALTPELEKVSSNLRDVTTKLRGITREVMPLQLEKSLINGLIQLNHNKKLKHPDVNFVFESEGDEELIERLLTKELKLCLYRVVQESIDNALKHSHAQTIQTHLELSRTYGISEDLHSENSSIAHYILDLQVVDDGIGFDPSVINTLEWDGFLHEHFGLRNMQQRVSANGGEFNLYTQVGQGVQVVVSLILADSVDVPKAENELEIMLRDFATDASLLEISQPPLPLTSTAMAQMDD